MLTSDWWEALVGGVLIGGAVSLMLLWNGRVTGVSGIISGLLSPKPGDWKWRMAFLVGLAGGGAASTEALGKSWVVLGVPTWVLAVAGLCVGFGTTLGSGCTSGHGVCGMSRMSPRSLVATFIFIGVGILSATLWKKAGVLP